MKAVFALTILTLAIATRAYAGDVSEKAAQDLYGAIGQTGMGHAILVDKGEIWGRGSFLNIECKLTSAIPNLTASHKYSCSLYDPPSGRNRTIERARARVLFEALAAAYKSKGLNIEDVIKKDDTGLQSTLGFYVVVRRITPGHANPLPNTPAYYSAELTPL